MIIKLCQNNNYKKESVKWHEGWGGRGFGAVSGADSELGEVRYRYLYRYVCICMFNVHIDRLPGPLATMISPPSSVTPSPLAPPTA